MGSVILKQQSPYHVLFGHSLVQWVHYVPLNSDLSDIIEKITSCQSIALTMTDRLHSENIEELLINRIIDKTDELNGKFANCIAIVTKDNFPELLSLCLDYKTGITCATLRDKIPITYFIGCNLLCH